MGLPDLDHGKQLNNNSVRTIRLAAEPAVMSSIRENRLLRRAAQTVPFPPKYGAFAAKVRFGS